MPKEKAKTVRVNVNIPEDLYWDYKKRLMDDRTNTTYDLIRYMRNVVEGGETATKARKSAGKEDED